MSVSDETKEIRRLLSKYKKEDDPKGKYHILGQIMKSNARIQSEISTPADDYYKEVITMGPPLRRKGERPEISAQRTPSAPKFIAARQPSLAKVKPKRSSQVLAEKSKRKTKAKTKIPKAVRKRMMSELGISEESLKEVYKKKKEKVEPDKFTIYTPSTYGSVSNRVFGSLVNKLAEKQKVFFSNITDSVKISGIHIMSKTYISMMFFTSFLACIFSGVLAALIAIKAALNPLMIVFSAVMGAVVGAVLTFMIMYAYPASRSSKKSRLIDDDLPFAIIHMAAVAGSGGQPISMFKLLLKSGEYKGIESEIKKIVNYVNLFGYDLSTALKNVSLRTPSKRFKDVLNGIASTIESGGSLKSYLNSMADDAMTTYKLERKKYVETLATYSDIYTGVLIAAPLLFMVTLAIINIMGGTIGGIPISTIATGGVFIALPLINVIFYLFLNIAQPRE